MTALRAEVLSRVAGFPRRLCTCLGATALGLALAGGLPGSLPAPAHAQGSSLFSPAVTVNGTSVTNYQVEQRLEFLTLLRAPGADRESVVEKLTEETLQVQAATAAGLSLSPEELEQGLAEIASRTNLEPAAFIAALGQEGVASETVRDFVRNGLLWRNLVRQRFGPRAQISEAEIDRALALAGSRGSARILLSEIAIPLPPQEAAENQALANRLSEEITGPAEFAAAARQYSAASTAPRGGRLDWLPLSNLPPQVVGQVLTLAPGEVTEPVNLGSFVALFLLRDLEELTPNPPETLAVTYAEVRIPGVASGAAQARAQDLRARLDTCDDLYGQDLSDTSGVARQSVLQSELSADLAFELAKLDANEVSTQLTEADALRFIMLCGRSFELEEGARDQIRGQLRQQRLISYADGLLAQLRADAVISRPEG